MVFKTVRGSRPAPLLPASSALGNRSPSKIIPRISRDQAAAAGSTSPVMTLFPSGFAGPRLLGGDVVRSGA
jgi:hypothetical protein